MKTRHICLFFLSVFLTVYSWGADIHPSELCCESMTNPTTVEVLKPHLSWINKISGNSIRGQHQTAYRIFVAMSKAGLSKTQADVWDSGIIKSAKSHLVSYNGPVLKSGCDYWWKVQTWDANGKVSEWSEPAYWGMGLLSPSEWKAKWIGAPWQKETARKEPKPMPKFKSRQEFEVFMNEQEPAQPAPLLRKLFSVSKQIARAKVFVTGLGYFELYLNGKKVGDDCLVPNFTDYTHRPGLKYGMLYPDDRTSGYRVMYLSYDVTTQIKKGKNMIGGILGDGFYDTTSQWDCPFGSPRFLCQLELVYTDGTKSLVVSDETWTAKKSAIRMNGVFDGEIYDARKEICDWSLATSIDKEGWQPVALRNAPDGKMTAQTAPVDKVVERLHPVSLTKQGDGTWLVDFGTENSGWIRFKGIKGNAGDTLSVKYICEMPLGIQKYIFKGDEKGENYAPRFTWFVFSKAVISGVKQLTTGQLIAEKVNTNVPVTSEWETSNELFNKINTIWQRTQTDNMHGGIASDCPHRERSPYTGDGEVSQQTVMHNFGAEAFYRKWITDIRFAQNPETGYVPNGAPWQPRCGGGVAWGAAMNLMPWEFYLQYGDKQMLADNFKAMKSQVGYMLTSLTPDGTMLQEIGQGGGMLGGNGKGNYWLNLGDWCPPSEIPSNELVHTFYLWRCADYTARAAHILGMADEEAYYRKITDDVKAAFNKKFYNATEKSYGKYGSNVFALKMGVPQEYRKDVAETLHKQLMEDNKGHLDTGIFATQFLFEVLAENGLNEVAYEIMNQTTYPSFGYWIAQGATTMWEKWDGKDSRNHPMMGGGLTWFYRKLAGIQTDETEPGYRHIIIRPQVPAKLEYVKYANQTPYGRVASEIRREGKKLIFNIVVPVGSYATVYLPSSSVAAVSENGKSLSDAEGVSEIKQLDGEIMMTVGQGVYSFCL